MDSVGEDTGAENVAAYIARRQEPGSYHILVDSDSVVELLPPTATAFHCAASGYNGVTVGVSYACRTVDLEPDSGWFRAATELLAGTIVRWWREAGIDPVAGSQFVPAGDTRLRPGLSTHGEAQPVDRSDAWTRHPRRAELERVFTQAVTDAIGGGPKPDPTGEVMEYVVVDPRPGRSVWLVSGTTRFRLASQGEIDSSVFMGAKFIQVDPNDPQAVEGILNFLRSRKDLGRP